MQKNKNLNSIVRRGAADCGISCSNMVVTLFGDVVSEHGDWLWLGSIIEALVPMGYSERLVRTAVYRLMQNDWLQSKKIGRKSFYCITDKARGHYESASRRIYAGEPPAWDGSWILVVPALVPRDKQDELRKALSWRGFNTLVTGMYAHPSSDTSSLDETIYEQGLQGEVIVLSAKTTDMPSQEAMKRLVKNRWNLDALESMYTSFIHFFRPLAEQSVHQKAEPAELFYLRLLLIHEYRRILLRDPDFPEPMLPRGWVGREAQQLTCKIYQLLQTESTRYISTTLENTQGPVGKPRSNFYQRFGGLPR